MTIEHALSLLTPHAVREHAQRMLAAGLRNELHHFRVDIGHMDEVVDRVLATMQAAYPTLQVPLHSRWRHFVFDGTDRWTTVADKMPWPNREARARAEFDLAIISVFLDAGAGARWRYGDRVTGQRVGRSEGLALATLDMFMNGAFSSDARNPFQADATALANMTVASLRGGFQVAEDNPLLGLEGRTKLLQRLGTLILERHAIFARKCEPRPGGLFDHFAAMANNNSITAPKILIELLTALGPIWPSRIELAGIPLGDCWRYPAVESGAVTANIVPLHKLSQWLAYSLIEPLERAQIDVTDLDGLTGLAEYRNGGLFLDAGVLQLRHDTDAARHHDVASPLVIEWRALTVALLDIVADALRKRLGRDATALPLASVLQGGTWATGRALAFERRSDGSPPIHIESDGTVF